MTEPTEDQPVKIPPVGKRGGKWIAFGDEQYRVPALGFGAIAELQDDVELLRAIGNGQQPGPQHMAVIAKIVQAAMVRNYPDITEAQVADMLDLDNYQPAISAVLSISGFTKGPATPGGALASTGAASTSH